MQVTKKLALSKQEQATLTSIVSKGKHTVRKILLKLHQG
jgi:hypothetical protein